MEKSLGERLAAGEQSAIDEFAELWKKLQPVIDALVDAFRQVWDELVQFVKVIAETVADLSELTRQTDRRYPGVEEGFARHGRNRPQRGR